jgi:hypothetical protein
MPKLISLDVDGVLADMVGARQNYQNFLAAHPDASVSLLDETPLWWGTFGPLGGELDAVAQLELVGLLAEARIHIVTRRPENSASVTVDWIQRHFPIIATRMVGISCVPFSRTKAPAKGDEMFPDVAIDDDPNEILDYWAAGVPCVVAVGREVTRICSNSNTVHCALDVWSALRLALA